MKSFFATLAYRFLLLLCPACIPGSHPPAHPESGKWLSLELPPLVTSPTGPLRILHFSPQGTEQTPTSVNIVFDRPIRALAGNDPGPQGFTIEPPVPGHWTWVGTHAVAFEPTAHQFPRSTAYHVRIPEQLRGIDGTHLQGSVVFDFETSRPKAAIQDCPHEPVKPKGGFAVTFSQEITDAELQRVVHVQARPVTANEANDQDTRDDLQDEPSHPNLSRETENFHHWPIRVKRVKHEAGTAIRIYPEKDWPIASQLRVLVDSSLRSVEGPLPALSPTEKRCRTYQPPRAELDCARNDLGCYSYGVELRFDNPPLCKDLTPRVRVEPVASTYCDQSMLAIGPLKASSHYRVTISKGLHGVYGGVTLEPQTIEFDTQAPEPHIRHNILDQGQVEPHLLQPMHVTASDALSYRVAVRALSPGEYIRLVSRKSDDGETDFERANRLLQGAWEVHQNVRPYYKDISLKGWLDSEIGTGAVLVDVDVPSESGRQLDRDHQALVVSDLDLTTKLWLDGAKIWVTSLKTQEPVAQAQVTLIRGNRSIPAGLTGTDGSLTLLPSVLEGYWVPGHSIEHVTQRAVDACFVLVQKGRDWNVQRLDDGRQQALDWAPPNSSSRLPKMFLFLDRGVYRLGESIHIKGYVQQRQQGRSLPLAARAVTVSLWESSNGTATATSNVTTNAFGAFSAQFVVPKKMAEPFDLAVWAQMNGQRASRGVPISEYRPVEFDVRVRGPKTVVAGEKATFEVEGNYLYGDPMSGALVDYSAYYEDQEFVPPNTQTYTTSASELRHYGEFSTKISWHGPRQTVHLGTDGRIQIDIEVPRDRVTSQRLMFKNSVYDAARRGLETHTTAWVHPADYYVGLRTMTSAFQGHGFEVDGIAVNYEGAPVSGRTMEVTLLRVEPPTQDEVIASQVEELDIDKLTRLVPVAKCSMVSSVHSSSCSLVPRRDGKHVLLARSRDEHGRWAQAAIAVSVMPSALANSPRWGMASRGTRQPAPVLELDQQDYHWGDEARLKISSPFKQAWALVTLQRDGIYWSDARMIGSSAELKVPVLPVIGTNAQVSVILLRHPGRESLFAVPKGYHAYGTIALRVAKDEQGLSVAVAPSVTRTGPGEKFDCDFQVTNRHHQPSAAELSVWVVDEGVLKLTGYELPNPLAWYSRELPLETSTLDSHWDLALFEKPEPPTPSGPFKGGISLGSIGSVPTGSQPRPGHNVGLTRHRGPPTILFQPHLLTDDRGRAHLSIQLPQQLSSFRVMAVAASQTGDFGGGEAAVAARLPMTTRPMMPRFARVGDEFEAGVVVGADASFNTPATVKVLATGVTPLTGVTRTVNLTAGRAQDVMFRWRAEKTGTANFRVDVTALAEKDAVAFEVPVRQNQQRETIALYGETEVARAERVGPLPNVKGNSAKLDIALANTPLVGLSFAIEQLANYPNLCSEQLASRLLLLGPLRDFARSCGVDVPPDYKKQAQSILQELLRRQNRDGGFRYWDIARDSDPWLSAYVTWVMARTDRAGIQIGAQELRLAVDYVLGALRSSHHDDPTISDSRLAFLADVAAEVSTSRKVNDALSALTIGKDKLPLFARAWLLHALLTAHGPKPEWKSLTRQLEQSILVSLRLSGDRAYVGEETDDYGVLLDSSERTVATVLRALLAYDRNHPIAPALLRGLLASRKDGAWRSTQASAWALNTLAEYQSARQWAIGNSEAHVWLDQKAMASTSLSPHKQEAAFSLNWPSPKQSTNLIFEQQGKGTLFYSARLTFEQANPNLGATSEGFEITHSLGPLSYFEVQAAAAPLDPENTVTAGQTLLGEVVLFSPVPRHHINVEVNLPAGLEPIDPSLTDNFKLGDRTHDWWDRPMSALRGHFQQVVHDDRINFYIEDMARGTVRLPYVAQANTVGTFTLPPARVEEMYHPEHYASTPTCKMVVTPRVTQ